MDFTIEIVSQNLVTKTNFVEFQDHRIFPEFRSDRCRVNSKNEIFRKIPKNVKYLKNVHLRQMKFKLGQNKLFRGKNGPRKCDTWRDVSHMSHV